MKELKDKLMSVRFIKTTEMNKQTNYIFNQLFNRKIRDYTYTIVKFSDKIYLKILYEITKT
jgi:hypothetical protein